ncbi:MAG: DNA-3-methyladenine glycosylase I [Saprospiraceae bacterium]|nr:DNA-3-methyladenine glycosylase I [Saprospiraceae bacterium]
MNEQTNGLIQGEDGLTRCWWCGHDPFYQQYHDMEWGRPVHNEIRLFEKICLEGFQSGLSWLTILRKREHFREAFAGFDVQKIARFNQQDIERLMSDAGIIRNRRKIEATIQNARAVCRMYEEGETLSSFFWSRTPPNSERPKKITDTAVRQLNQSPTSIQISKDLKSRGFTFVGPVTMYAHMQAMGMVNDHIEGCFVRDSLSTTVPPAK